MSEPARTESDKPAEAPPVVVKKYANRRLYNTESSSYITLDNLADMVRKGRDFVVYDAKTGEDITRSVLTQIIVEEEGKGRAMLPTSFLRQLIGFYGDSMQNLVPRYPGAGDGGLRPPAAADARGDAEDDGQLLPLREHGGDEPAEHGDDGAGDEPVHALLSPDGRREPGRGRPSFHSVTAGQEIAALQAEVERLRKQLAEASGARNPENASQPRLQAAPDPASSTTEFRRPVEKGAEADVFGEP